jgi:hypothetical protein
VISIVLSICLLSDPTICREQPIPVADPIDPVKCMLTAMPYVAQWGSEHPNWQIVRMSCRNDAEKAI